MPRTPAARAVAAALSTPRDAGDLAGALGAQANRVKAARFRGGALHFSKHAARIHRQRVVRGIDVTDASHPREADDDPALARQRHGMRDAVGNDSSNFLRLACLYDAYRVALINATDIG